MKNEVKKKETKVVRGYSLSPVNLKWLKAKAVEKWVQGKETVSTSAMLDALLDKAREDEKRDARILANVKARVKAA